MNLPNILTLSRVGIAILFIIFFQREESWAAYLAFGLFSMGAITDFLDGYLARKNNQITDLGKILDPITDKFLILSAFFVFMRLGYIGSWMFWAITLREILVTVSRLSLMRKGIVLPAEKAGKVKTVLQMFTIFVFLSIHVLMHSTHDPSSWVFQQGTIANFWLSTQFLMILTITLTLYSGVQYFWNNRAKLF